MKLIKFMFKLALVGGIVGSVAAVIMVWVSAQDLPDYAHMRDYAPPIMSRVHAGDGTLIGEYARQRRIFVPFEVIPEQMVHAFISAEDKNFYTHIGLDFVGIARAFIDNIGNIINGRRLHGASTITQQVAKNFLLSSDISIKRKVKEAILAIRLERAFEKHELLELYLNEIYLGMGNYGVAAAALKYFDKSLDELTLAQIAYIAALPKGPNNYHPIRRTKRAIERRNWVINRMVENGYVGVIEGEQAKRAPLTVTLNNFIERRFNAEYFVEEIRREVYDIYGRKQVYEGGLSIRTTLNTDYQRAALRALRDGLVSYDQRQGYRGAFAEMSTLINWPDELRTVKKIQDIAPWRLAVILEVDDKQATIGLIREKTDEAAQDKDYEMGRIPLRHAKWARPQLFQEDGTLKPGNPPKSLFEVFKIGDVVWVEATETQGDFALKQIPEANGALIALDPHTGRVLAMVGGYSFALSEFNRAIQAKRQPGSAFKPFVYACALDNGYKPNSIILDVPFVIEQSREEGLWKPKNYSGRFYGPSTLRLGLEYSRNLMTIRLAQKLRMRTITNYTKNFNITDRMPPVLSMALGAMETSLMRLTNAYAILVNGGKEVKPILIDRIQDRYGKTIYKQDQRPCDTCNSKNWTGYETVPMLADMRERKISEQTAYQIVSMLEGAVQRGTGRSVRSIGKPIGGKTGTTNDSRDAWFIGFSPDLVVGIYVGYDDNRSLGARESGGRVAAPVFKSFMKAALADKEAIPFRVPPEVSLVRINAKTGQPAQSGDNNVILEAFKAGNEPSLTHKNGGRKAIPKMF